MKAFEHVGGKKNCASNLFIGVSQHMLVTGRPQSQQRVSCSAKIEGQGPRSYWRKVSSPAGQTFGN